MLGSHSIGTSAVADLDEGALSEVGAQYGFKGSDDFSSFLMEYRYNLGDRAHHFDVTVEKELMDIRWRAIEKIRKDPNNFTSSTELLGAIAISDNYSLIGGARYDYSGRDGRGTVIPEVGIQYKDVPIIIEYNPEQESVGVRVGIRF